MSVTIDIAGLPSDRYLFAASPLGELSAMLHALAEPAHHPELQGWITTTLASLSRGFADRLLAAEFLWRSSRPDFLLPSHPAGTLAEDLDAVDRIDDESYVATALVTNCGSSRLSFRTPSPLTDPAAKDRARELALARGPRQAAFADRLIADPPAARAEVRRLLDDCEQEFFADAWGSVRQCLATDARRKADLLVRRGLADTLAAVSPTIRVDADRQLIVLDKLQDDTTSAAGDGITFIPTVFGRPHVVHAHARRSRPVIQYPVPEPEPPHRVALDVVQQRLEALAHPVRLRLCRTLARGPHTTGELADAWQLTAPEVSRHLAVLRRAGLLSTRRRGRYVLYELDLVAGARLGSDLLEAMLR
ncbi:winged helix-turn-helix transcriptional regulator [Solihabitans fulvus]|uniref:Winged helix-turn-helix transcriptional regulator n=1 Tax=Solihabitans fulvus TaxID=1892852 RepID=A0A5B2WTE2_9PSEU|nr:DUF5937 family protein [Solihabitans fulvus]KAA2253806.1 winged helix-turn-helix transcriptional regulator [Solihabitans fulvus]